MLVGVSLINEFFSLNTEAFWVGVDIKKMQADQALVISKYLYVIIEVWLIWVKMQELL